MNARRFRRWHAGRRGSTAGGFTPVEVLTVVAVISVLAGLVLAGLAAAREESRRAVCTSNLRQIALAVRMYLDDTGGERPARFQQVVDSGLIGSREVLLYPDDPTGNFGGINIDSLRRPSQPPETVRCSYMHAFYMAEKEWRALLDSSGSQGVLACVLHDRVDHNPAFAHSLTSYEGLILRLQLDGAVVRRHRTWPRTAEGGRSVPLWRLFSDDPDPIPPADVYAARRAAHRPGR